MITTEGPPRGEPRYRVYCAHCERFGSIAGWRYMLTGKPVPPEEVGCPECGGKLEVLGREDQ
jgi:hypothetical protein